MTNHDRETPDPPIALCCCGTPLVSSLEVRLKEWYCATCKKFYEFLHARRGSGENPTEELQERYEEARRQYDSERAARREQEARCTEQTANAMLDNVSKRPAYSTPFEVAIGIPLVLTESVSEGRVQIWQDGKMVTEIVL